jgi:hypothetical protein
MPRFAILLVAPLLALAPAPAEAADPAASPASQQALDPHEDLYAAMAEAGDQNATLDAMLGTIADQLMEQQPLLKAVEDAKPGLKAKLRVAVKPVMADYWQRARDLYKPKVLAMMREELTPAEAQQLAIFYRSPATKSLLKAASANYTGEAVIGGVMKDPSAPVPASAVKSDIADATLRGLSGMTEEQQQQFATAVLATPAISKLGKVNERIAQLRVEMEETPLTPDEEARLATAVKTTIEQHIAPAADGAAAAD